MSSSRAGCGTLLSTASISASTCFSHFSSPFSAPRADNRTTGTIVARELVRLQQLAHFQLDQVQQFGIVNRIALVQRNDDVRHTHLTSQKHVLARLRHRTVRRRNHQNRAIHLRRARDHVLDVVGVARAIDVRIMPIRRLILDVRRRNRDPARLLFRSVVDRVERPELDVRIVLRQYLRDRRRQRRLAVIDVSNRPYVAVRLCPIKFFLRHFLFSFVAPARRLFLVTPARRPNQL